MYDYDYEYNKARALYEQWCEEVAEQCEEEGYPSHGSNYELRIEGLWEAACEEAGYPLDDEEGEE